MRVAWLLPISILVVASCGESRRPQTSTPTSSKPSCTLPICEPCACDMTTGCDPGCSACDAECGNCRSAEAECAMPRDAGPASNGDGSTPINPPGPDSGPRVDAGPCNFPLSQGLSEPCCIDRGIDACGAGLFCEAFDGRTQPTCYANGSRRDGETCSADGHCARGRCPPTTRVCSPAVGDSCTPNGTPCADDGSGRLIVCDVNTFRCVASPLACDPNSHQPCPNGESCYATFDGRMINGATCFPTGSRERGASCSQSQDCRRDMMCLAPFQNQCVETCSPSRPCMSGTCTQFDASGFGVCIPR